MKKHITKTKKLTVKQGLRNIRHNVAGIDIGANSIFVCASLSKGQTQIREFSTFTADLKAMVKWLKSCKIASVAMESTGVYWIVPYDMLEVAGFEVILVNPASIKAINRTKTDVMDCQWIQELHSYGLLKGSFRPDAQGVTFRAYVRQRKKLTELNSMQIQLMHKALTQMNIQLRQVLSNITGVAGMKIIRAIIAGKRNPKVLAKFRTNNCKRSESKIAKSLEGNFRDEHLFALQQALEAYNFYQKQISECELQINKMIKNWPTNYNISTAPASDSDVSDISASITRILGVNLTEIPGLNENLITQIVAEIGTDISKWKTAKHFASWLGLSPSNKISGGKILSSKSKPTANKAAQAFRLAANALYRSKTALGAYFRRMRARLGTPKALTATAHKIAVILYSMIRRKTSFKESGQDIYEQRYRERTIAKIKNKASMLGYSLVKNTN